MQSENAPQQLTHTQTLSSTDKVELIDLLQHKTKLLITARLAKIADKEYIDTLRKEVEDLQNEVKNRRD